MTRAVSRVETERELADALAVRRTVFVEEQGVPAALEVDEFDALGAATHVVAYEGERAVGAARLRPVAAEHEGDDETTERSDATGRGDPLDGTERAKVERVAVVADRRGEGLGAWLMDAVEAVAREQGVETLVLHAQTAVEGFYAQRGYRTVGEEFEEAGIAHVEMVRAVSAR